MYKQKLEATPNSYSNLMPTDSRISRRPVKLYIIWTVRFNITLSLSAQKLHSYEWRHTTACPSGKQLVRSSELLYRQSCRPNRVAYRGDKCCSKACWQLGTAATAWCYQLYTLQAICLAGRRVGDAFIGQWYSILHHKLQTKWQFARVQADGTCHFWQPSDIAPPRWRIKWWSGEGENIVNLPTDT